MYMEKFSIIEKIYKEASEYKEKIETTESEISKLSKMIELLDKQVPHEDTLAIMLSFATPNSTKRTTTLQRNDKLYIGLAAGLRHTKKLYENELNTYTEYFNKLEI